ncbi:MAG: DUF3500 domain-containing protein [Gemmataceae bacterium]|nr:DUF3500 domain-containing protein [Gemmataceae bacterium]
MWESVVDLDRRAFLKRVGTGAAAAAVSSWWPGHASAAPTPTSPPETAVKALYDSLTEEQRRVVCFDWNHTTKNRGLLRTFVSNNWFVTEPRIRSDFYTRKQQDLIHDIFKGLVNPDWYERFLKQLRDDTGGKPWGADQSIAIFGKPGEDRFEFVITGRHHTLRADGNSEAHVAFGGPIFYGHAAESFNEKPDHPGNVFWPQALEANKVWQMLDAEQRRQALLAESPDEAEVGFQGPKARFPGLPVAAMSEDQKTQMRRVLALLIEPFRTEDRDEVMACLKAQGGLDACSLAFYADEDIGKDGVWDNWRLEGPSFVWYFRGSPHVHVWVNVADDPKVPLNAKG